jgi:hypothetical protein
MANTISEQHKLHYSAVVPLLVQNMELLISEIHKGFDLQQSDCGEYVTEREVNTQNNYRMTAWICFERRHLHSDL